MVYDIAVERIDSVRQFLKFKTRDIIKTKELLGHVNINNTLIYLHLEKALFNSENAEFSVKLAKTVEEACKLIEVGFEYVCDMEGVKLFRQRK